MTPEKQPVIQSVFDRRMAEKNEMFFQKAMQELDEYERIITVAGQNSDLFKTQIATDAQEFAAFQELVAGLRAGRSVLSGVVNAFDVLIEDEFFV